MKKTKNLVILVALFAIFIGSFSCKKGEEDPFISLRSRAGRLEGEWTIKKMVQTETSGSSTSTVTIDGTTFTETSGGDSNVGTCTSSWKFEKDGKYSINMTIIVSASGQSYTDLTIETGNWNFSGGNNDTKEKELLIMQPLTSTTGSKVTTYTGMSKDAKVYKIVSLKNKEMKLSYDFTETHGSTTTTEKMEVVLEQK